LLVDRSARAERTGKDKIRINRIFKIGTQEMLETEINFEPNAFMTTISIPDPNWTLTPNFRAFVPVWLISLQKEKVN
jgi:hypothetical protein